MSPPEPMFRRLRLPERMQSHPLLMVVLPLVAGIIVGDRLTSSVTGGTWLILATFCLLFFLLMGKQRPCLQSLSLVAGIFCFGCALVFRTVKDQAAPSPPNQYAHYEAVVVNQPRIKRKVVQCDIMIVAVNGATLRKPFLVKASLLKDTATRRWQHISAGSGLKACSRLRTFDEYVQKNNFDYLRWLQLHGFSMHTFVHYQDYQPTAVNLSSIGIWMRIRLKALRLRSAIIADFFPFHRTQGYSFDVPSPDNPSFDNPSSDNPSFDNPSSDDQQDVAVMAAMVLGDKQALSQDTKEVYSISGASHVLALSGLHLSIIYAMLFLLLDRWRRQWWCQAIVLLAVWMYVVMVGMGASVVRSALMLTLYSFGTMAGRGKVTVNTLAFAAICLLIANPLCLWDVGFQLSFMAVLAIALFCPPIYRCLPLYNPLLKAFWGMAAVSIAAQLGTAPLVAYYFGRFSCWFLLTNFIVVPAASVIIYGTVVMLLLTPIPYLSSISSTVVQNIASLLNTTLSRIASLPLSSVEGIRLSVVHVVLIYIAIASVAIAIDRMSKARQLNKLDTFY